MCHTHLICLEQNIALQPEIHIDILHLSNITQSFALRIIGSANLCRCHMGQMGLEQTLSLLHGEQIRIADKSLLHGLTSPDNEILTLEVG